MNNKGKGSGLVLIILLLVALLIGYFAMTQMEGLGFGMTNMQTEQTQQNAIEQAQSAVLLAPDHSRALSCSRIC